MLSVCSGEAAPAHLLMTRSWDCSQLAQLGLVLPPPMPPNLRGTGIPSVVEDAGDAACGLWEVRGKDVVRGLRIDPLGLCVYGSTP